MSSILESTMRTFDWAISVAASVYLLGTNRHLEVTDDGVITIPNEVRPEAFKLSLLLPKNGRVFIAQKDVQESDGGYHAIGHTGRQHGDWQQYTMLHPITVQRAGKNVWTQWHVDKPNRVDCWQLSQDGELLLFQIGVITHDDGRTWRLHGETRYRGTVFQADNQLVVKPVDPVWGPFTTWANIFEFATFKRLLKETSLQPWTGSDAELNPPLRNAEGPGYAVMQWYVPFAGQTGQGPATLHDGSTAWVHGVDINDAAEDDGVKRLRRNNVVSYRGTEKFGKKPNGPPKLVGVTKVAD